MSTWSGGRTLTKKQREEKRRKDRMTKRCRKQAAERSTSALKSELEHLRRLLTKTQDILSIQAQSSGAASSYLTYPASAFHPTAQLFHEANPADPPLPDFAFWTRGSYLPAPPQRTSTYLVHRGGRSTAGERLLHEFGKNSSTSLVQQLNETLARVYQINPHNICLDEKSNQDILIRGVLDGWSNLDSCNQRCPLWDILREIDEGLFVLSDFMTRFSMLRAVHFLLLVRESYEFEEEDHPYLSYSSSWEPGLGPIFLHG